MSGSLNGELETKQVKIIGYHAPPVPVPDQLAHFALKFTQSLKKDCLYKRVAMFLVIIQFSVFKRISLIQNNSFLWKIYKNVSKSMKHIRNTDILFVPTVMTTTTTTTTTTTKMKKHSLWVHALKKGEKQWVLGLLYRNIYRIQKINFQ